MPTKNLLSTKVSAKVSAKSSPNSLPNSSANPSANNFTSPHYLIDSHCHLHDREFFTTEQAREMLARAIKNHVTKIVCIGTNINDSLAAQKFANDTNDTNGANVANETHSTTDTTETNGTNVSPTLYWTFGIHPENAKNLHIVKELTGSSQQSLQKIFQNNPEIIQDNPQIIQDNPQKPQQDNPQRTPSPSPSSPLTPPIAIGEVGLDYHYPGYDRAAQIKLFETMLQLALDHHLPLSLHIREAFDDFLAVIKNFPGTRAVVHSFSDNKKHLRAVLETTDFYIGVNGMATYSTLPTPPLDRTILETDAPFLTPKPFRGIINEPGYVSAVAKWLAEHLGQDLTTVQEETTKNATRLFGL